MKLKNPSDYFLSELPSPQHIEAFLEERCLTARLIIIIEKAQRFSEELQHNALFV